MAKRSRYVDLRRKRSSYCSYLGPDFKTKLRKFPSGFKKIKVKYWAPSSPHTDASNHQNEPGWRREQANSSEVQAASPSSPPKKDTNLKRKQSLLPGEKTPPAAKWQDIREKVGEDSRCSERVKDGRDSFR